MTLPPFHLHPTVDLLMLLVEGSYLVAIRNRRRAVGVGTPGASFARDQVATRRQITLFSIGVGVLWIGAEWPIHDLAERYLYSVHMFQHLLFTFVAPPLLIAGLPVWMLRRMLAPRPVAVAARVLTRPIVALAIFNGVFLLLHWPAGVTLSVQAELFPLG